MGKDLLTAKQRRFVDEYLLDLNASQAYIRAGYAPKHADVAGPRLLGNVGIQAAVKRAMDQRSRRTQVSSDRVVTELARMGFVNIRDLFTDEALRPLATLTEDDSAAIVGLKIKRRTTTRTTGRGRTVKVVTTTADVKLEKHGALVQLARHLGIDKLTVADERLDLTRLSTETLKRIKTELGLP